MIDKIKNLKYSNIAKLFIYFLLIYLSTECLNGNNGDYIKYYGENAAFSQKLGLVVYDIGSFFWVPKILYAGLIYACVYNIFYGITRKTKLSCAIISTISVVFGIVNFIVIQARGTAITIADIFSVQTALNVAKGISVDINGFFVAGILLYVVANFLLFKKLIFNKKENELPDKQNTSSIVRVLVGFLGILFFMFLDPYIFSLQVWDVNVSYKNNGAAITLMRLARNLKIDEPENYSGDNVENILDSYDEDPITSINNMPNILVIMNESFADLLNLYDINASGDNLPFFHSLMNEDNVISGNLHSSFIGGRTANVEFEFLTQNSITAFPVGSYPYQQYINDTVKESFASYMNELGYDSYAIHSWYTSGYNRKKIYNLMQFENIIFKEDMPDLTFLPNGYSTDSSSYEYWYNIMNNKAKNKKNFTFLLTVQNHLPYENSENTNVQYVSGDDSLNTYLNFVNESDNALKELISFVKKYDEDTVVLFFGDHQPNLDLNDKYGPNEYYENEEVSYIVPFFIWTNFEIEEENSIDSSINFDIEEKNGLEISANFLQNLLLEVADIPKNEYDHYIDSIMQEVPVITMQYYIDKNGNRYDINDSSSPYYDMIEEYKNVVYYQMFEEKS